MLFYSYVFNLLYKEMNNPSILDLLRNPFFPGVSARVPKIILAKDGDAFGVSSLYMWIKYKASPATKG